MNPTFRSSALVRLLLRVILRPLFRVRVTGDAGVFVNDRTLIVANHESFLDGLLLGAFLPIDAVFVVHAQALTKWYFRLILRYVPHLAVDSASPLSMKLICRLVETGKPVRLTGIFHPAGSELNVARATRSMNEQPGGINGDLFLKEVRARI